jgi:putative hemolysin
MIPRLDVIGIEAGASMDSALDIAAKYGHSRLPVYEEDLDHIVGILHVKDLIQGLRHPLRDTSLRGVVRPVHYVPDTAKADDLLRDLLKNRMHMAVVVDEYGGTAGVLTIEDALEEIVGEIRDEYDSAEEPEYLSVNGDEVLFKARVPVSEVNDVLTIKLPTEETDTLGGLVYTRLGKMPKTGDRVMVGSVELTVTGVIGRRIRQVRVRRLHPVGEEQTVADTAS